MFIGKRRTAGVLTALAVLAALALINSVWDRIAEPEGQPIINGSAADTSATLMAASVAPVTWFRSRAADFRSGRESR